MIGRNTMPMVTVSISPEQAAKMRDAVDGGAYASGSEVVREALRLWATSFERENGASTLRPHTAVEERLNVAELYAAHTTKRRHG